MLGVACVSKTNEQPLVSYVTFHYIMQCHCWCSRLRVSCHVELGCSAFVAAFMELPKYSSLKTVPMKKKGSKSKTCTSYTSNIYSKIYIPDSRSDLQPQSSSRLVVPGGTCTPVETWCDSFSPPPNFAELSLLRSLLHRQCHSNQLPLDLLLPLAGLNPCPEHLEAT